MGDHAAVSGAKPREATNPFTFEDCHLPHISGPCGTHGRRFLEQSIAEAAIERAFRDAGYRLTPGYPIRRDGITCIADGFDPVHRIGYIYADYDSVDWDAFNKRAANDDAYYSFVCGLGNLASLAAQDHDEALFREVQSVRELPIFADQVASLNRLASQDRPQRLSLAEAKQLISRGEESGEFIAVISQFDWRFDVRSWEDAAKADTVAIALIPDAVKRRRLATILHEKLERQTAEQLRRTVHEYIAWARNRGLQ